MTNLEEKEIYISTFTKLPAEMPAAGMYKCLDIGIVINIETGVVSDIGITLLTEASQNFIKKIVIGYSFNNGVDELISIIKKRYFGAAQKALMASIKILYERYREIKSSV